MVVSGSNYTTQRSQDGTPSVNSMDLMSPRSNADSNISIKSELGDLESPEVSRKKGRSVSMGTGTCDQGQVTDNIDVKEFGTTTSKLNLLVHLSTCFVYFFCLLSESLWFLITLNDDSIQILFYINTFHHFVFVCDIVYTCMCYCDFHILFWSNFKFSYIIFIYFLNCTISLVCESYALW